MPSCITVPRGDWWIRSVLLPWFETIVVAPTLPAASVAARVRKVRRVMGKSFLSGVSGGFCYHPNCSVSPACPPVWVIWASVFWPNWKRP